MSSSPNGIALLEAFRVIRRNDHFVLSGGEHSDTYIDHYALEQDPAVASLFCDSFARRIYATRERKNLIPPIETVIAPAPAAVVLAHQTAHHLEGLLTRTVLSTFAEKSSEGFFIRPWNQRIIARKSVLVMDDVVTTSTTLRSVMRAVGEAGGNVVAVGAICNRGKNEFFGVPFISFVDLQLETYPAHSCPLCADRVPVNAEFGRGAEFLARTH